MIETLIEMSNILSMKWNPHPDEIVEGIHHELSPIMDFLKLNTQQDNLETIQWILMELVMNAVNALFSYHLITKTQMSRNELLLIFQANPLWSEVALQRFAYHPSHPAVKKLEEVLAISLPEFLRCSQREKFQRIGACHSSHSILVVGHVRKQAAAWEIFIQSSVPPTDDDIREITRRFDQYETTKAEILEKRESVRDAHGLYWLPSFTGGGGMGLLACLASAQKNHLALTFQDNAIHEGKTIFRLATA